MTASALPTAAMKAFTLWQPWASLAVLGLKGSEFRGYPLPAWMRGRHCAIHAAARDWRREAEELLADLETGSRGFGLTLDVPRAIAFLRSAMAGEVEIPRAAVIGSVIFADSVHASLMPFMDGASPELRRDVAERGNYGWRIKDPQPFTPCVPASGQRGFWNWRRPSTAG